MNLTLHVSPSDDLDIYLQIRYQLTYLITTGQLEAGARLPSVRELASNLGVSRGSASLAYRELQADGLIDAQVGRGTFVRAIDAVVPESRAARHQLLVSLLDDAARRAVNLGFSAATILQRMNAILSPPHGPMQAVFIGTTQKVTQRYTEALAERMKMQSVHITGLSYEEFMDNGRGARQALRGVYFVITFALQMAEVERVLNRRRTACEVLGVTTEASEETLRHISAIEPAQRVLIVSQPQFLQGFVNLVRERSRVAPSAIRAVFDTQEEQIRNLVAGFDVVAHSSGIVDLMDRLEVPSSKRLDLVFRITANSYAMVESTLLHDTPARVRSAREVVATTP